MPLLSFDSSPFGSIPEVIVTADRQRAKKGRSSQAHVDHLRMVDSTIPRSLAPRSPNRPARRSEPYVRSSEDQALVDALRARQKAIPQLPRLHAYEDARGLVEFEILHHDHEVGEALLMAGLGVSSSPALETLLHMVLEQCRLEGDPTDPGARSDEPETGVDQYLRAQADFDLDRFNRLIGTMAAYHPQTEMEAQLAFHLVMYTDIEAELHALPADNLEAMDFRPRLLERTANIIGKTIDRLHRQRQTGEQRHIVKHIVTVSHDDGQHRLPSSKQAADGLVEGQSNRAIGRSAAGAAMPNHDDEAGVAK